MVWEKQLSGADEEALQDAMLQRLAEKEPGYYGKPALPRPGALAKGAAPGAVCAVSKFKQTVRWPFSPNFPVSLMCLEG